MSSGWPTRCSSRTSVALLAGDDAHWITGQTIHVSGGQV
jgi:NAD(P)-dependent dehydrogenase (short-subunit alcohol dehydrogenase family)